MSRPVRTSPTSARKRGRPAQLSRQRIVATALELLAAEPAKALTMQRLARALDAAPMALYTHVRNRADLMQVIADTILGGIEVSVEPDDWAGTVRRWAWALRAEFLRYPFMAQLLNEGIGTPAAWLRVSNPLLQALQQAGLRGAALADAQRWVSRVVFGSVLMELVLPAAVPEEMHGVRQALLELPESERGTWLDILPELGRHADEDVFAYTLDRTIDALEAMSAGYK